MKKIYFIIAVMMAALPVVSCSDLTEMNNNPVRSTEMDPDLLIRDIQFAMNFGRNRTNRYIIYPGSWCNHWTGQWSVVEYGGKGQMVPSYTHSLWDNYYKDVVWDLVALENLTKDSPEFVNHNAIAKVLRVEAFSKMTDTYGDIPYFEGGQGYFQGVLNPKYDKQEDIYNDFFKILDEAIGQFDENAATPDGDLFFGGDVIRWRRLAASLKLRMAMRLIKVAPDKAKQYATEAYESGLMESNEDTAYVVYDSDSDTNDGNGNPWSNEFSNGYKDNYGPTQYRLTTEFFKALIVQGPDEIIGSKVYRTITKEDPRLLLYARCYGNGRYYDAPDITVAVRDYNKTNPNTQSPADLTTTVDSYLNIGGYMTVPAQDFDYGGGIQREYGVDKKRSLSNPTLTTTQCPALATLLPGGVTSVTGYHQRLQPSKFIMEPTAPWIHMSFAESEFLLAETTLRGWGIDSKSAAERFSSGFKAAVKQWSIYDVPSAEFPKDADIDAYLDLLLPDIQTGGDTAMEMLTRQLWILYAFNVHEAWTLIRRTNGMPSEYTRFYNRYPDVNMSHGLMPRRIMYPQEEQTRNGANWQEARERLGVDEYGDYDSWLKRVWWDVE